MKDNSEERRTVREQTKRSSISRRTSDERIAGSAYVKEAPSNDKNKPSLSPHETYTPAGEKASSVPMHLSLASDVASTTKSGGKSCSHLVNNLMTSTIDQFMYETVAEVFGTCQANHLAKENGWDIEPLTS